MVKRDLFNKRKLVGIAFLLLFLGACKKEPSYSLEISIENKTEDTILLNLFPQSEYLLYPDLYRPNDSNKDPYTGPFVKLSSELVPKGEKSLFSSRNIDQEPYSVAALVFDSIIISFYNEQIRISFSLDTAIGYSDNLYDSTSSWDYEVIKATENFQYSSHPVEIHSFKFVISTVKIEQ